MRQAGPASPQRPGEWRESRTEGATPPPSVRTFSLNSQDQALGGDEMSLKDIKNVVTVGERDSEASDTD